MMGARRVGRLGGKPLILALMIGGCGNGGASMEIAAEWVDVPEIGGNVSGVAALADGAIVASFRLTDSAARSVTLGVVSAGSDEVEDLQLPQHDGCVATDYFWPQRLADGRVGAVREHRPSSCADHELVALDVTTGAVEVLAIVDEPVSGYAWSPDGEHALVSSGSDLCSALGEWREGAAVVALAVEVVGRDAAFTMADAWAARGDSSKCEATGWASEPTIAGDGRIAFMASTAAIGMGGPDRALASAFIFTMNLGDSEATPIGPDIREPRGLAWSPDGNWLLFSGVVSEEDGTWMYAPATDKLVRVSELTSVWHGWHADGSGVVTMMRSESSAPLAPVSIVNFTWRTD